MYFNNGEYGLDVIRDSDLEDLMDHRNNMETWKPGLSKIMPLTMKNQLKFMDQLSNDTTNLYFIAHKIEDLCGVGFASTRVGLARVNEINWVNRNAMVGCDVFLKYRKQGHSYGIMKVVLDYCFGELGLHRAWLFVVEENEYAVKAYERNGMKREGIQREHIYRNGKYHNHIMMSVLKGEYEERKNIN